MNQYRMLSRTRGLLFGAALATTFLFAMPFIVRAEDPPQNIRFRWAFLKRTSEGKQEVLPLARRMNLKSGDEIRFYFKSSSDAYYYLYLLNSAEELQLHYPVKDKAESKKAKGAAFHIPGDSKWFMLDQEKGTETFYLLVSDEPLKTLEQLTQDLQCDDEEKKTQVQGKILAEIKSLRRQHSRFAGTAEKPVSVAGVARSIDADVEAQAVKVATSTFYAKTIKIEHN